MVLVRTPQQNGNMIFILFVCVALFGGLSYVVLQNSRASISLMEGEADKATAIKAQDCINTINMAVKRLEMRGCGTMISYAASGINIVPGSPTDGSCSIFHPNGGGAKACNASAINQSCNLTTLGVGQSCEGIILAGISGGNRIYTDTATIAAPIDMPPYEATGATSTSNGLSNTNIQVALGPHYQAATICRAKGVEWYLPAINELSLLYTNRNVGELAGKFVSGGYWSSTEASSTTHTTRHMGTGVFITHSTKNGMFRVTCVRRD